MVGFELVISLNVREIDNLLGALKDPYLPSFNDSIMSVMLSPDFASKFARKHFKFLKLEES